MSLPGLKTRLEERGGRTVFVINRAEWQRGDDGSSLFSPSFGTGCCLGLAALVEGAPPSALAHQGCPHDVDPAVLPESYKCAWLTADEMGDNGWANAAMQANDAETIHEDRREREIASVFRAARGWDVEFEG